MPSNDKKDDGYVGACVIISILVIFCVCLIVYMPSRLDMLNEEEKSCVAQCENSTVNCAIKNYISVTYATSADGDVKIVDKDVHSFWIDSTNSSNFIGHDSRWHHADGYTEKCHTFPYLSFDECIKLCSSFRGM